MPIPIRQDDLLLRLVKDVNDIRSALRRTVANLPLYDISNENTPAQITTTMNDYVPGNFDVLRLSSHAFEYITGISGGVKGRFLRLINSGNYEIGFAHQSVLSLPQNRIISATGREIRLNVNGQLLLYYDQSVSRWIAAWASSADRKSVELRLNNNQAVNNASYHQISWENEYLDTGDFFDPATPTLVTIPESGWYEISLQVAFDINGTGERETMAELSPVATYGNIMFDSRVAVSNASTNVSISKVQWFPAGAQIFCTVWQNSLGVLNVNIDGPRGAHTRLVVARL